MKLEREQIDLVEWIKTIWAGRKLIVLSAIIFGAIGLMYAFLSSEKYSASAVILPSASDSKLGSLGGLGAFAGMAGLNISSMLGQGDDFDPALYPKIAQSTPFLLELMNQKIYWKEYQDSISFYDYCEKKKNEQSFGKTIYKYSVHLPFTIINYFSSTSSTQKLAIENINGYYELTENQVKIMDYLSSLLVVDYQKSTGLISISITLPEPIAVAQLTQNAVDLFQKYIVQYKIKKVADNLEFLEKRGEEKRLEYESCQKRLMAYRDSHRDRVLERTDFEYQKLSDSYDIIVSVYKGLIQSIEQSKVSVKQETPVFSIIMPVVMPLKRDSPKRLIVLVGSLIFGFSFGVFFIFSFPFLLGILSREDIDWGDGNWTINKLKHLSGII